MSPTPTPGAPETGGEVSERGVGGTLVGHMRSVVRSVLWLVLCSLLRHGYRGSGGSRGSPRPPRGRVTLTIWSEEEKKQEAPPPKQLHKYYVAVFRHLSECPGSSAGVYRIPPDEGPTPPPPAGAIRPRRLHPELRHPPPGGARRVLPAGTPAPGPVAVHCCILFLGSGR